MRETEMPQTQNPFPKTIRLFRGLIIGAIIGAGLGHVSPVSAADEAKDRPVITVFAASSATDCMTAIAKEYEATHAVKIRLNFASSSVLARQIEEAAPCDVFLSADQEWMDYLAKKSQIQAETRKNILGNSLVIITPAKHPIAVQMNREFNFAGAFASRLAVGDPAHVPAGKYAQEALQNFGWWNSLTNRLVPAMNVRDALKLVERGETDAGIVYLTDAHASKAVTVVATFPEDSHKPILYPVALCIGAKAEAKDFLGFLSGTNSVAIWTAAGFTIPR